MSTYWKLRYLAYGAGITAAVLALAWYLNSVFERSFQAIALIMLAMVIVMLIRRMVEGGIPEGSAPIAGPNDSSSDEDDGPPTIHEETRHLPGVDYCFGWMALAPATAALIVLVSVVL